MTDLAVFRYDNSPVRTVVIDSEPWFVLADICAALDIANPRNVAARIPERRKGVRPMDTPGGRQNITVVDEPGAYMVVMRSDKAAAVAFQEWLAEVATQVRRTGRYEVAPAIPRTYAEALRLAADEHERAEQIQQELEAAAPKAEAWDVLASAHGDYSVREAAFILNRDPAIDTGQRRLFQLLRDWRLIDRRDIPYADHARHVRLRARTYDHPRTGEQRTTEQVRITAEGLRYLHRRLGGTEPLAA